jgi:hypothetical protein
VSDPSLSTMKPLSSSSISTASGVARRLVPSHAPSAPATSALARAVPVADPPGGQDGNVGVVLDHPRQEGQKPHRPRMASGLVSLGDEQVGSGAHGPFSIGVGLDLASHPDPGVAASAGPGTRISEGQGNEVRSRSQSRLEQHLGERDEVGDEPDGKGPVGLDAQRRHLVVKPVGSRDV